MKHFFLRVVLTAIIFTNVFEAVAESVTVNLTREGTLAEKVLEQASSLATVTELTVKGKINSADWNCITVQMTSLATLNMKGATASFETLSSFNQNITSFIVPEGIKKLKCRMTRLTYIEISNSVETIGGGETSYNFEDLQTIKFGNGLKSIVNRPFDDCENLNNVFLRDVAAWCRVNLENEDCSPFCIGWGWDDNPSNTSQRLYVNDELITKLVIPYVEAINAYAFYNCIAIQSIEIAEGCNSIGESAFDGCTNVSSISFPTSLTEVGSSAFSGCSALQSIALPSSLTSIGSSAFSGCSSLQSIALPSSLTSIGFSAFSSCTSLTEISFPESIISIGSEAFSECI